MDDVSMNVFFFKRQVGVPYHGDSQKFTHLSLIDFWPLHFRTIFVILTKLSIISKRLRSSFCNIYRIFYALKISWVGPFEISRGCYEHINFKYTFYELKQSKKTIWSMDLLTFISFCHSSYYIQSFCSQFLFIWQFSNGFTYRVRAVARSENPGGHIILGGDNVPPPG